VLMVGQLLLLGLAAYKLYSFLKDCPCLPRNRVLDQRTESLIRNHMMRNIRPGMLRRGETVWEHPGTTTAMVVRPERVKMSEILVYHEISNKLVLHGPDLASPRWTEYIQYEENGLFSFIPVISGILEERNPSQEGDFLQLRMTEDASAYGYFDFVTKCLSCFSIRNYPQRFSIGFNVLAKQKQIEFFKAGNFVRVPLLDMNRSIAMDMLISLEENEDVREACISWENSIQENPRMKSAIQYFL
jgi:hypothetical protein